MTAEQVRLEAEKELVELKEAGRNIEKLLEETEIAMSSSVFLMVRERAEKLHRAFINATRLLMIIGFAIVMPCALFFARFPHMPWQLALAIALFMAIGLVSLGSGFLMRRFIR